jgi:hypothetical protein
MEGGVLQCFRGRRRRRGDRYLRRVDGLTRGLTGLPRSGGAGATTSPSTPGSLSRAPSVLPVCGPILQLSRLTYRYPYHRSGQYVVLNARFFGNP